ILIFFWYPAPHFSASGGWQGLKIAASVDLVLGPLLTFIVFDPDKTKKKLIGDLVIIALIQIFALAWGVNTIYQQRPVSIVFWEDGFYSVPASAFKKDEFDANYWQQKSEQSPPLIYAEKPQTNEGLIALADVIAEKKIAPHHQVSLYRPLSLHFTDIQHSQIDIKEVTSINVKMRADLEKILLQTGTQQQDYLFFPLYSKYQNIILLFDKKGILQNYISVPHRPQNNE
ncbi:UNVERIFIED_CONTAM: hypothetical protein GTU68_045381, partial [Idotea baltica]|nr:hypothetical protein [Idotea baltica]